MNDHGWKAGEVEQEGDDGYYAARIDLTTNGRTHYGAVVVYGANEKTATGRRNFLLRAINDHTEKSSVLTAADVEELAVTSGMGRTRLNLEQTRAGVPEMAIGTWQAFFDFARSVPSGARIKWAKLRRGVRDALGLDPMNEISDEGLVDIVKALKAGRPVMTEPTNEQVDEFIEVFHAAARGRGSYRDNIEVALKAALSK